MARAGHNAFESPILAVRQRIWNRQLNTETPPLHAPTLRASQVQLAGVSLQRLLVTMALAELLVALWLCMHRYNRFYSDAQLYAFQALARLRPALASDLFLSNSSQDQFTIFSPAYALFARLFGLETAALALTVVFTVWFLSAVWFLARNLATRDLAWLAVAMLIITRGEFGAYGVFHFAESFLTARLPAEALVVTALAVGSAGHRRLAITIAVLALFVHPLMALPGLALVVCMGWPTRITLLAALSGVGGAFLMALFVATLPAVGNALGVADPLWLDVVRQRSQFLFVQFWKLSDWETNVRPLASLAFSALVIRDPRTRKFCMASLCIAIAGLVLAAIASLGSPPVAILLQGQPWRWVWIAALLSVLLVPATVAEAWRNERCGPLCALLLICAWTFQAIDSCMLLALAICAWILQAHLTLRAAVWVRWATILIALILTAWIVGNFWTIVRSGQIETGREPLLMQHVRSFLGLQLPALLLVVGAWYSLRHSVSWRFPTLMCLGLAAIAATITPFAFAQVRVSGSDAEIREFADWRRAIPPTSSVFVADGQNSGLFVWFTLERPNYLTLSQSAGVVFSRPTALEVRRRAQVLLPLVDPSWMIKDELATAHVRTEKRLPDFRPLTLQALRDVCRDPELGFVIAKEDLDLPAFKHTEAGPWKDWKLYDCNRVRVGPVEEGGRDRSREP
jgi:hypothetical protein